MKAAIAVQNFFFNFENNYFISEVEVTELEEEAEEVECELCRGDGKILCESCGGADDSVCKYCQNGVHRIMLGKSNITQMSLTNGTLPKNYYFVVVMRKSFTSVKSESLSVTELATSFMDRKTTGWIRDLHPIESEDFDLDELSDEDFHIRELKSLRDKMMEEIDARLDKPGFKIVSF